MRLYTKRSVLAITVLFLIVMMAVSSASPVASQGSGTPTPQPSPTLSANDLYYYYQGKKTALELSTQWVAVKFAQSDSTLQSATVNKFEARITAQLGSMADARQTGVGNIVLLPLRSGATEQVALDTVNALSAQVPGVEWAGPVFNTPGALTMLTLRFIAQFPANLSRAQIDAINQKQGVRIVDTLLGMDNTFVLEVTGSASLESLRMANFYHEQRLAVYAEPDFLTLMERHFTPNDQFYNLQWHLHNTAQFTGALADADIDAPEAWDITQGSSDIIIAVIDDGVDLTHPDLSGKLVPGYDFANNDSDPSPAQSWHAHGTSVAGLAAASSNNTIGVAGVCHNCRIMPIKLSNPNPDGSFSVTTTQIVNSLTWPWQNGASVLNNSWGGGAPSTTVENAIINAITNGRGGLGAVVIFSAGNGNTSPVIYPAAYPSAIAVGASNWCDQRKTPSTTPGDCNGGLNWGSHYGPELDVSAPGMYLPSTDITGAWGYVDEDYVYFGGTSGSAPITAGVVGLMLSANPNLTRNQVKQILESTADDTNSATHPGWDQFMGWGRINAHKAVQASAAKPDTIGVFRPSNATFYLRNSNTTGPADISTALGLSTDLPVVGDWNGDGIDTVGVFRPNTAQFFLRNSNAPGAPIAHTLTLGIANDVPIAGDWDGNGSDSVGVFRPSNGRIYLRNALTTGVANFSMVYGIADDRPVAGDWNGNGVDSPGVFRPSLARFFLTNQVCNCVPTTNHQFNLGLGTDVPIAGDWDGNGSDSAGVFRPSNGRIYLRNALTTGSADITIVFGIANDRPVAGKWTGTADLDVLAAPVFEPPK